MGLLHRLRQDSKLHLYTALHDGNLRYEYLCTGSDLHHRTIQRLLFLTISDVTLFLPSPASAFRLHVHAPSLHKLPRKCLQLPPIFRGSSTRAKKAISNPTPCPSCSPEGPLHTPVWHRKDFRHHSHLGATRHCEPTMLHHTHDAADEAVSSTRRCHGTTR